MCWLSSAAVLLGLAAAATPLRAELVLDDFDDLAETISPAMENVFVSTANVGAFNADRRLRIAAAAANPEATFDTDATSASVMTADLSALNTTSVGGPALAFQFKYAFAPTDISQGGLNDAIILDFRSLHGNEIAPELGLVVRDDFDLTETYFGQITNLPLTSGPFSASILFSSFTQRGGAPGLPDFTTIKQMDFDFFFFNISDSIRWRAELERIRIGKVPEPASIALCAALVPHVVRRTRRHFGNNF